MNEDDFDSSAAEEYISAYGSDQQRREKLAGMVQSVGDALRNLDVKDHYENVEQLKEIVLRDAFKVLVIGEFKTGKSTFINALLGKEILPSYATPTTAILNEVKWGEEPCAVLHFCEEGKEPMQIPVSELEDYVVIKDTEEEIAESPYTHVELFWPLDLCRNHIEIIDSPGLNESEVREKVTMDYLRKVDAVLFVMTALRLGPSMHEQQTLETLELCGHEEPFLVVNQFDLLRTQKDRDAVTRRAEGQIATTYTKRTQDPVHFVSALQALEGRLRGDSVQLESSGMLALEGRLHDFLGIERSRIKAKRAARDLQIILSRLPQIIRDRRAFLRTPVEDLKQRHENAQSNFQQLQTNKSEILRRLESFRRDLRILVTGKVSDFFLDIEGRVDEWAAKYQLSVDFNLNVKSQIEKKVREICESLNSQLDEAFREWAEGNLVPLVEERIDGLRRDLERLTENFEASVRQTRFDLRGAELEPEDLGVIPEGPSSALERTLAAAGGFFVAGFAGAGLGAVFGWKEVAKAILPMVTAGLLAGTLGLPLLPLLIVAALLQGGLKVKSIKNKLKQEVAKHYRQKLRESGRQHGEKIFAQVDEGLDNMATQLERGLQVQIDEVQGQVETILREKEQGQQVVDAKLAEIDDIEQQLTAMNTQLFAFIATVDTK